MEDNLKTIDLAKYARIIPKYIVFFTALASVFGSMFYSEVEKLLPCDLCWYQRILIYPIVIVMVVAVLRKDSKMYLYTTPMAVLGWMIAFYNYLLQKTDLFEGSFIGCDPENPCSAISVEYLGFITIPFMSLVAFTIILVANWVMHKYGVDFE